MKERGRFGDASRARSTAVVAAALTLIACADAPEPPSSLHRAPPVPTEIDGVVFEAGDWEPHLPAGEAGSWVNHTASLTGV